MQHLIKHLLTNNREEILSKSLLNCHVKGLHSLMLLEAQEKTIRLFVTDTNHEMFHNNEKDVLEGNKMTIGLHPHHCNLTLYCIKGRFMNWIVRKPVGFTYTLELTKYLYASAIKGGGGKFVEEQRNYKMETFTQHYIHAGYSVEMAANVIHSVAIDKGKRAAWLVFEGKEDKNYKPLCYSNADLVNQSTNGLYGKPTEKDIYSLLEMAGFNKNQLLSK